MVETKSVSDALWEGQGALGDEFQGKTLQEDEQRVNPKELQAFTDGGEINLAAHCGDNIEGSFIHSLAATDVFANRLGTGLLLARGQSLEVKGLEAMARHLPCTVLGTASDNNSLLINDTRTESCADRCVDFTRSRASRRNGRAWVKQKDGAAAWRFPGHERYPRQAARQNMDHLHGSIRLHVNFSQPSFNLMDRTRKGSVETKSYTFPATPSERLIQHERVGAEARASRNGRRYRLSPVVTLHSIRETQSALAAIAPPGTRATPIGESLERSLARVLDWWRLDEEVGCGRRRCEPRAISERGRLLCGCMAPFTGVVAGGPGRQCGGIAEPASVTLSGPVRKDSPAHTTARSAAIGGILASKLVAPVFSETSWGDRSIPETAPIDSGPYHGDSGDNLQGGYGNRQE